ncbi:MAG: sporulation initiation factor Spo0A C-terminal domain-containing protein [Lachnospiraceae bacterium]|nr:sporulation initiation factor Spo0A C-terminal domain-containing protein [Lachnospiraceae bacterium]
MNMRKIYRKVAKAHKASVEEVRREMQYAIEQAWNNPEKTSENIAMQRKISPDGSVPTPDVVIKALAKELDAYK